MGNKKSSAKKPVNSRQEMIDIISLLKQKQNEQTLLKQNEESEESLSSESNDRKFKIIPQIEAYEIDESDSDEFHESVLDEELTFIEANNRDLTENTATHFIFAYIKRIILKENENDSNKIIPQIIANIIAIFSFNFEYFSKYPCNIIINLESKTSKYKYDTIKLDGIECKPCLETLDAIYLQDIFGQHTHYFVYGNIVINNNNPMSYIWRFRILRNRFVCIGIDSSNKKYIFKNFVEDIIGEKKTAEPFYAFFTSGYLCDHNIYRNYKNNNNIIYKYSDCDDIIYGDIIKMEINIISKYKSTLKFCLNDKDLGIAFENITFDDGIKYHMTLGLHYYSHVQLIDFDTIYH